MYNFTRKYKNISKKNIKKIKTKSPILTCSICYENIYKNSNISILSCKHTFHSNCISKWCREKHKSEISCPECRYIILPEDTTPDPDIREIISDNVIQVYRNDILQLERQLVIVQLKKLYTILPSITLLLLMWIMSNPDDKYNTQMIILGFSLFLSGVICKK